ncbi:MAG: diguanylate cyclase, partial [Deltaproteobacteria bacterium]|nr:diguanylate cyclase [Deltaproteobacteria bacterium]
ADRLPHSIEFRDQRLGRDLDISVIPLYDPAGQLIGAVHITRDITDRKAMEQEREKLIEELTMAKEALEHLATHDSLTGLLNRGAILERLRIELSRAHREGFPIGMIMIDLDNFKSVNDRHGHLIGDAVLREAARRITSLVRPYDAVGRYGGEEFIVVLPGCDRGNSADLAERLRTSFCDEPLSVDEGLFSVTLSCGVTAIDVASTTDIDACIRAADEALYKAKRSGRNRVELT